MPALLPIASRWFQQGCASALQFRRAHCWLDFFEASRDVAKVYRLISRCCIPRILFSARMGGHGEQHCLICGGPASWTEWQGEHVGITEDNVPMGLFKYDEELGWFSIHATHLAQEAFVVGRLGNDGLTCHASCHQLLCQRLGYTLLYEDVLPLLLCCDSEASDAFTDSRLDVHSLLNSQYGREVNLVNQVFAQPFPTRTAVTCICSAFFQRLHPDVT